MVRDMRQPNRLATMVAAALALCLVTAACGAGQTRPAIPTCQLLTAAQVDQTLGLHDVSSQERSAHVQGTPVDVCDYNSSNGLIDAISATADYASNANPQQILSGFADANAAPALNYEPSSDMGEASAFFSTSKQRQCVAVARKSPLGLHVVGVCVVPGLNPSRSTLITLVQTMSPPTSKSTSALRCPAQQACAPITLASIPGTSDGVRGQALVQISVSGQVGV